MIFLCNDIYEVTRPKTRYEEISAFLNATAQKKTNKLLKALTVVTLLRSILFYMELESVNNNSAYHINDIERNYRGIWVADSSNHI